MFGERVILCFLNYIVGCDDITNREFTFLGKRGVKDDGDDRWYRKYNEWTD